MKIFTQGRYATVTSTLALVIAVGGTSYAAAMITGNQIQDGTVTSRDVQDRSLKTRDLAPKTVSSLTGQQGPAGPQGEQGPIGPSKVITVDGADDGVPMSGDEKAVLSLNLQPGSYAISVKGLAERVFGGNGGYVSCRLDAGGVHDVSFASVDSPATWAVMAHQLVLTTATVVEASVWCFGSNALLREHSMTAVKVGAVERQPWPPAG